MTDRNNNSEVTERAITVARRLIANEIGVIEASRVLTSPRHEFSDAMGSLFLPFVGIDSETDNLPIGPVRGSGMLRHWREKTSRSPFVRTQSIQQRLTRAEN